MNVEHYKSLMEKAKSDPGFFHALVFTPEKVLDELQQLDRRTKGRIVGAEIEEILARVVGVGYCGNTCSSSCDNTCGGSCGYTTNIVDKVAIERQGAYFSRLKGALEGCGNTCSSSCDNTCGQSCGYTTNRSFTERFNPAEMVGGLAAAGRFGGALEGCGNTCSSSCDNTCGQSCGYTTNRSFTERFGQEIFR